MTGTVAFVVKGYPRLSETFIANEICALEQCGLDIRIVSLRAPTDGAVHPVHREIRAPVLYLPEYLWTAPLRVARAVRACRRWHGFGAAFRAWLADLALDPTPNRVRRFGQALVLAHEMPPGVDRLHAHFLHTPASVARYAAILLGLPWSVSAHAKDIWTTPDREIRRKLADCAWAVTCTRNGQRRLAALAPTHRTVELVYHGVDLGRFPARREIRLGPDGSNPDDPVVILSVGRAVEKKGYGVLLDALARLPETAHWRFVHIGGGPLKESLLQRATELGLAERTLWLGARPQGEVLARYRTADVFVLASTVLPDGDRDGLANVLVEAQSQGLACVTTTAGAAAELIEDGVTGILVPPSDAASLAAAMTDLVQRPERRLFLGRAAETRARTRFAGAAAIGRLAQKFGLGGHARDLPERAPACVLPSTRR